VSNGCGVKVVITSNQFLLPGNGEEWKEQRKFSLRVLHHLGFGKQEVEDAILDEVEDLIRRIDVDSHKPIAVHRRLGSSVSNVVTLLITGKRYDYDHPIRVLVDDSFLPRGNGALPNMFGAVFYLPIIAKIAGHIPMTAASAFQSRVAKVVGFMREQIEISQKTFDPKNGNVTCFIEAYLKEMAENTSGKHFDLDHLIGNAFSFFAAGTNTTGDFLTWFMLYMMVHPVVQRKMRQEIDEVIGSKRVSAMYRDAMPYTEAVIQELHRHTSIVPSGIAHAVGDDVNLEGYMLPKGTQFIMYSYAIHMDPEHFSDPEVFIPERFISSEGKFIRDERVMPFGFGKRSCPGEPIANTETFLYIVSFLQKFEIEMPKGRKYTTNGIMEFVGRIPSQTPIEVLFKRRQ
jgi:cytochrome P450